MVQQESGHLYNWGSEAQCRRASWRREVAASLGVAAVAPDEASGVVTELTQGAGVPLVVEASGSPAALVGSLSLLAHEGVALVGSWYGTKPVTLPKRQRTLG